MNTGIILSNGNLKQEESKNNFINIKSDYILKNIFKLIKRKKQLEIVINNNKLKKRLNLSINDYIEYSQLYSSIEIELKPADYKYGKFINIKEEELEYFHIYFDISNEEQIRNYIKEKENVKTIKIKIDYQIKSFNRLFTDCK